MTETIVIVAIFLFITLAFVVSIVHNIRKNERDSNE
jgi:hypothetical protein